jgi:hypothetical protein
VIAALALVLAAAQAPDVTASVDRTRVRVGEEITLTIRARTRSQDPLDVMLPPFAGLTLIASREFSQVSFSGDPSAGASRTTVREVQLRVDRPGSVVIGAVRVRQGRTLVETTPITLTVDTTAGMPAELSPIARRLLEGAPPPARTDQVALTVLLPADTILTGQQLDIVAAAWFPRELAARLRRPPVVQLGTPAGVWAYSQPAPVGIAVSRQVNGEWMDLVVAHQVVFPLAAGRVVIPPARLTYAVPVTFSFFSREERYALHTDSGRVTVLPLPLAGRPADDAGVVGQGLTLDVTVEPAETRVGEPVEVTATITGTGNVALWPEPALRWPPGFRTYPAEASVRVEPTGGRIAGVKTFRYLAVPDSAGRAGLPDARYPYYDLALGAYAVPTAAVPRVAVQPGLETRAARALPPLKAAGGTPVSRLAARIPTWAWAAWLVVPPLALVWARRRRRRGPATPAPAAAARPERLAVLERDFLALLDAHVPDAVTRGGPGLASALRAAGVEGPVADHVVRLRERLRAARYGPAGVGDATELAAELERILQVLGMTGRRGARRRVLALIVLGVAIAGGAAGQAPGAEALYRAGALRAAADSFAARAAAAPWEAAHWYNLAATLYRAGADGKAVASWTLAARLAPRDPTIRHGRALLPPPDPGSEALLAVGPATPAEWALVAGLAWLGFWLAMWRRWRAPAGVAAVLLIGAGAMGAVEWRRRDRPVAVVLADNVGVREAPHGAAATGVRLTPGAAVIVGRRYGRWIEVRRPDGIRGWVRDIEVAPL